MRGALDAVLDYAAQAQAASSLVAAYKNTTVMKPYCIWHYPPPRRVVKHCVANKNGQRGRGKKNAMLNQTIPKSSKEIIGSAAAVAHVKWFAFLHTFFVW